MGEPSGETIQYGSFNNKDKKPKKIDRIYTLIQEAITNYLPENIAHTPHLITSIGCGPAQEAMPIIEGNEYAYYHGIDVASSISWNNTDLDNIFTEQQRKRATITHCNAADSEAYKVGDNFPEKSNAVLILNPDLHAQLTENWREVLEEARHHVEQDHVVIVTLDDDIYLKRFQEISDGILQIVENKKQSRATIGHPETRVVIARFIPKP